MTLQQLQDDLIQDGQRLSAKFEAGTLHHDEWSNVLEYWNMQVDRLPEDQRGAISLELFQHIEPEKS
jgi:hypothetical protein